MTARRVVIAGSALALALAGPGCGERAGGPQGPGPVGERADADQSGPPKDPNGELLGTLATSPDDSHAGAALRSLLEQGRPGYNALIADEACRSRLLAIIRSKPSILSDKDFARLIKFGDTPVLVELLAIDEEVNVQFISMQRKAIPGIDSYVGESSGEGYIRVASAVGNLAAVALVGRGAAVAPALVEAVGRGTPAIRRRAAFALGGLKAPEAVPCLARALDDPDPTVAVAAAESLGGIGTPEAARVLTAALACDTGLRDAKARVSVIYALGKLGPLASDAVPMLVAEFAKESESMRGREAAVIALGEIGPAARAAVPELALMLDRETDTLLVAPALWRIAKDQRAVRALLKDLRRGGSGLAAEALGEVGPDAAEAIPDLVGVLFGEPSMDRSDDRDRVIKALVRIDADRRSVVHIAARLVEEIEGRGRKQARNYDFINAAEVALGSLDPDGAVSALKMLRDKPDTINKNRIDVSIRNMEFYKKAK